MNVLDFPLFGYVSTKNKEFRYISVFLGSSS